MRAFREITKRLSNAHKSEMDVRVKTFHLESRRNATYFARLLFASLQFIPPVNHKTVDDGWSIIVCSMPTFTPEIPRQPSIGIESLIVHDLESVNLLKID
jgi:hypothetical protein